MKEIKLGIIGTNFVSDWLCDAAESVEGIINHAVYSRTAEKGAEFAGRHGISEVYTDLDEFFSSDIDAVYIASPNFLHYDYAMRAIESGKHVLLEKPAALNVVQFDKIISSAGKKGVKVIEAMRPAHDPALITAKEAAENIGTIRRAVFDFCQYSSRYDKFKAGEILNAFNPDLGNAAIMDIGVYAIEVCVILFGKPRGIYSKSVKLHNGMEGMGTVFLDYGELQAEAVYSKITESPSPSFILGEDGYIKLGKLSTMEYVSVSERGGEETALVSGRFEDSGVSNMIYELEDFRKIIHGEMSADKFTEYTRNTLEIMDEVRRQNGIIFPSEK